MKILSTSFIIALSFTGSLAFSQTKVPVKTGEKIRSTINTVSNISQTMMGQDMEIESNITMTVNTEVKETSPDIHLSSIISRMVLKNQAMGQSMDFDSDKKEDMDGQIGQSVKAMIGSAQDIYVSSAGKPLEKKKDASTATAEAVIGGDLGTISLEFLLAIPSSVKAGDSWTDENNKDADNKKKMVYTVQSLNGNDATVAFTGEESVKKPKTIQGMTATITSTLNYKGTLTVNITSGVIKEKKTAVQAKGETAIMGQTIPFSLTQTISTSAR